ncbi:MAG: histidine phosphatase family protein [Actinomycetota bacterium]
MELLLVRHALPVRRELTEGVADPGLADEGHAQAKLLGEYLGAEELDAVYASSLRRAQQTATPVATACGLDVVIESGVAEYDRASSEYVPVEELKAANDPRWRAMLDGEWDPESDETREEFEGRVLDSIERIIGAHGGQRVAVVCHGGVINAYLSHILDLPRGDGSFSRGFFYPNYTSIHRVMASSSGVRSILTINETAHLRGSGLPVGMGARG